MLSIERRSSALLGLCTAGVLLSTALGGSLADAAPGKLLWEDVVSGTAGAGEARAVTARDGKVFAGGDITNLGEPGLFAVRAYDERTGALLWSDQPGGTREDEVESIHAFAHVVVVCGAFDGSQFGVIAYDSDTGARLWSDESVQGVAKGCNGAHGTLYAVGGAFAAATGFDFVVRAYDARTGVVLWEDRYDGGGGVTDLADAAAIRSGKLYVSGVIQQTPGDEDMIVRRYDAATGALDWQQTFAGPGGERDEGIAIAAGAQRVFVTGFASHVAGTSEWTVQAFDAGTGAPLWADFRAGEEAHDIALRRGRVVAAGENRDDLDDAVVRAYDAATGAVIWDQRADGNLTRVESIDTDEHFAYWGGAVRASFSSPASLIVRAVDLDTGATAWESVRTDAWGRDVVVDDGRLFVAGFTGGGAIDDFLVRAYRAANR
jgi:outer membrane protein assembly factor BamB